MNFEVFSSNIFCAKFSNSRVNFSCKSVISFLNISTLKGNKDVVNYIRKNDEQPKHLKPDFSSIIDRFKPNFEIKENDNELYYKVVETFYKYDLEGYKTDSNFNNMFDDGLHTFYAAHCDVFITNDDRCKYKAEKTYEKLHIKTLVIKSNEIEKIKNYG